MQLKAPGKEISWLKKQDLVVESPALRRTAVTCLPPFLGQMEINKHHLPWDSLSGTCPGGARRRTGVSCVLCGVGPVEISLPEVM